MWTQTDLKTAAIPSANPKIAAPDQPVRARTNFCKIIHTGVFWNYAARFLRCDCEQDGVKTKGVPWA